MSFNLPALIIAIAVAIIGSALVHLLSLQLHSIVLFSAGAVVTGLVTAFVLKSNDEKPNSTTLYVGNLPYRANEGSVRTLFEEHGTVISVRLLRDKQTGKRRGFGFVEVASNDCQRVIDALNDFEFQERLLKVRLANEK